MNQFTARLILVAAITAASQRLHAEPDLHDTLKDSVGAHWIYDDFAQARARAKQTGQPLLVLFRCVP
ncbi:MAG: thioredoxin family protein [Verrucomicrobiales bacterium]|nr:thioredoxin family protein [Verrucomicrobiales bacterium]